MSNVVFPEDDDQASTATFGVRTMNSWQKYPKHVLFIIGNEFCERFSFYGFRSVLLLYLRNYLKYDDDTSTSLYHTQTVLSYLFPLVGAVIADSYWGKYKTIFILSIVYVAGQVLNTIGSIPYIPTQEARAGLSLFGIFLIAFGTGGIKPCVSAFGGDQFSINQVDSRKQFFSFFYFAINAGSLISTFLTPVFRADVDCYPNEEGPDFDECFALSFGVPAILMVVALVLFLVGTKYYTIYPPEGSIFVRVCRCIYLACKNKLTTPSENRTKEHWLDYSNEPPKLIRDTKYVLRVAVLYIPLIFFWTLFDQQGSRWTLQAIQTNGYLGSVLIKPDQVETINPLLIVTLIPLFEVTLYPGLKYFKIPFTPLQRMTTGLLLAGLSFVIAAFVQIAIDKTITPLPLSYQYGIRFINAAPCNVTVELQGNQNHVLSQTASEIFFYDVKEKASYSYMDCNGNKFSPQAISDASAEEVVDIIFSGTEANTLTKVDMITTKTEDGGGRFSVVNIDSQKRTIVVVANPLDRGEQPRRPSVVPYGERSDEIDIHYGNAEILFYAGTSFSETNTTNFIEMARLYLDVGGAYSILFDEGNAFSTLDLNPNTVSVAWLIPQFTIITVGEVFLSITGLEFSYTQAPPSMKSVLASIWLFTVSLGNIIVIIVAELKAAESQTNEFLLFAGLIFVATLIFIYMAYKYIPVNESEFAVEIAEENVRLKSGSVQLVDKDGGLGNESNFGASGYGEEQGAPLTTDGQEDDGLS